MNRMVSVRTEKLAGPALGHFETARGGEKSEIANQATCSF